MHFFIFWGVYYLDKSLRFQYIAHLLLHFYFSVKEGIKNNGIFTLEHFIEWDRDCGWSLITTVW